MSPEGKALLIGTLIIGGAAWLAVRSKRRAARVDSLLSAALPESGSLSEPWSCSGAGGVIVAHAGNECCMEPSAAARFDQIRAGAGTNVRGQFLVAHNFESMCRTNGVA